MSCRPSPFTPRWTIPPLPRNRKRACPLATNYKTQVEEAKKQFDFTKNNYQVELDTTKGPIRIDLHPGKAPGHVGNFLALAQIGFYNGVIFHRVIDGFMIQCGCPLGTGTGGPGYTINAEFNDTTHDPGVLSMARTNDPNSAGSQFFLCLEKTPHLDRQYTAFGKTADEESLKTVKAIGAVKTDRNDKPLEKVVVNKATIKETAK